MAARLNLVSASAGKRLGAWLIDKIPPAILMLAAYAASVPAVLQAAASGSASAAGSAVGGLFLWLGLASLLSLAYTVWLWGWEATTGKTPGNLVLGLRTANEDGHAAGWGAIFLRGLIIAVGGLVLAVGAIVVVVSNVWDRNHKRQGWHDKVAKTLVLDVAQGRDPLTTGGLYGPAAFAPEGTDAHAGFAGAASLGQHPHGASPVEAAQQPSGVISAIPGFGADAVPAPVAAPVAPAAGAIAVPPAPVPGDQSTREAAPSYALAMAGPAAAGTPAAGTASGVASGDEHPDEEFAATLVRASGTQAGPLTLTFDDGRDVVLETTALIGRNPAAAAGEDIDQLIDFADMGRSVSKTHVLLRVDGPTVWVTDRNSTNGTAVTGADGIRRQLAPGEPVAAAPGATVEFGDRSFTIGAA
ncbi:RDD family protein [Arthrobacter sulfonylureivorans]|uniref:RDD family protein n=1 Tax=Arthrobacter sulfonylureivorans TaxID=2486855 RepID=A0ABY3WAZ9_9MICC|nr:RDD family protein [Arthrobacter sulfonylureivorans]UNK44914.1 RDD family protein [Arthrobacter sulfonylureivorans]